MGKRKQFTIVAPGNRFGEYLTDGMSGDGWYTKWQITVRVRREIDGFTIAKISDVKAKEISLRKQDIKQQTIQRTKEWYDFQYGEGEYPYWLKELIK